MRGGDVFGADEGSARRRLAGSGLVVGASASGAVEHSLPGIRQRFLHFTAITHFG